MFCKKGRFIIISSVSGGGKTSIIDALKKRSAKIVVAITATSRTPRKGEKNGVDYYFYSKEEFQKQVEKNQFLEHAMVHGNYYGVPAAQQYEKINHGYSVILNIDVQGKANLEKILSPERPLSIFILPPDLKTWEMRLRSRGTDSEATVQKRLAEGEIELSYASQYDYRIVNGRLEDAVEEIYNILSREGVFGSE